MKIPLEMSRSSPTLITRISEKLGPPLEELIQIDTYFQNPIRDFGLSDEALRVRQVQFKTGKKKVELTYKGPKQGITMKIREEITVEASNNDKVKKILENLGFEEVAKIKKKRINWQREGVTLSLDEVEDLGSFLEIEITTPQGQPEEISRNKKDILDFAHEIVPNWSGQEERKSYLELKLQKLLNKQGI
ncbi:MAG: class IV adenylate cyclase [Candidatus Heimdallarchaeota archaeon]|nr:MAG: class IV adenylate cyclase [Candidatus Heimdallarchaeota archaeon]